MNIKLYTTLLLFFFGLFQINAQTHRITPKDGNYALPASIQIDHLEIGKKYELFFDTDAPKSALGAYIDRQEATIYRYGKHTIRFTAHSETIEFNYPGYNPQRNVPRRNVITIHEINDSAMVMQGIDPQTGTDAETLIIETMLGDFCLDVQNVNEQGGPDGYGLFYNGESSIGIEFGIMLASGNITVAEGPNTATGSTTTNGGGSDPDLVSIAGAGINDCAILEFDFVPDEDFISFNYVFASEEYCDYVGSSFNDAFGFFLSGPGISGPYANGAINIATLPNGTDVTINNINWTSNSQYYVSNVPTNQSGGNCTAAEVAAPPAAENEIEFDGFTTVLTASSPVIACETYHIKLAIGDAGDSAFDSAVFIEGNSFISGESQPKITFDVVYEGDDETMKEGCENAYIAFRKWGFTNLDVVFDVIVLTDESTATEDLDYTISSNLIDLGPGIQYDTIYITSLSDLLEEGVENIKLKIEGVCSCFAPEIELFIEDAPPIESALEEIYEICEGEDVNLNGTASNGTPSYTYNWSTGENSESINVSPPGNASYYLTITDECFQALEDTTMVVVHENYNLEFFDTICSGESYTFANTIIEDPGYYSFDLQTAYGCDSLLGLYLEVLERPEFDTSAYSCVGECFEIAGETYCIPGQYNVLLPGASQNGCDSLIKVDYQWLNPVVGVETPDTLNCVVDSVQLVGIDASNKVGITYVWTGPNGFTSDIIDPWAFEPGTYTFQIIQNIGNLQCSSNIFEVEVMIDTMGPEIINIQDITLSCGITEVELNGDATNSGSSDFTFNWQLPDSTIVNGKSIVVNEEGAYTFNVLNNLNGCSSDSTVQIKIEDVLPKVEVDSATIGCNSSGIQLNSTVNIPGGTYNWTGPNGYTSTDEDPTVPEAGTYKVIYYINDFCSDSVEVDVIPDNTLPEYTTDVDNITCKEDMGTLSYNTNESTTAEWYDPNGNLVSTDPSYSTSNPGTYKLIVFGSNGCSKETEITLIDSVYTPDISLNSAIITCSNTTFNIGVDGSNLETFNWSGPGGFNSTDQNPAVTSPGTYQVTVTDINGCTNTGSVDVTPDTSTPKITMESDGIIDCNNPNYTILVQLDTKGKTYDWSGGGTLENDSTYIVSTPGIYYVTVTGANDCTSVDSIQISDNFESPTFTVINDTIDCQTGMGTLTAEDIADLSYTWFDSNDNSVGSGNTHTTTSSGIYTVVATSNTNGCTASIEVVMEIDEDTPDLTTLSDTIDCLSSVFQIHAYSVKGIKYTWTGPNGFNSTDSEPIIDLAGTYKVVVESENGCTNEAVVNVELDNAKPVLIGNLDTINCYNPQVTIDLQAASKGYDFSWTGPNGFNSTDEILYNITDPGTYEVTVTATNGCTSTKSYVVADETQLPSISLVSSNDIDCDLTSATLTATTDLTNWDKITWTGPNGFVGSNLTESVTEGGTYTVIITGKNGCTSSATVEVQQNAEKITVDLNDGLVNCTTPNLNLDATLGAGDVQTITWTGPNGFTSNELNPNISTGGQYVITIVAQNGCITMDTLTITEDKEIPTTNLTGGTITCLQQQVDISSDFNGQEGYNISWNFENNNIGSNPGITVTKPGEYTISIVNPANGCSFETAITINEIEAVEAYNLELGDPACGNNSGVIEFINVVGGVEPYQYSIDNGSSYQSSPVFNNLGAGSYSTKIIDNTGCTVEVPASLVELGEYTGDINEDVIIAVGEDHQIIVTTSMTEKQMDTIIWTPDTDLSCINCLNPIASPKETTTYSVTIIDKNGCTVKKDITIRVVYKDIYVPNIFSPNDDGLNDQFEIFADTKSIKRIDELRIFDRWGNLVHLVTDVEPNSKNINWNGRFNGKKSQEGVYAYLLKYTLTNDEKKMKTGNITLIR